MVRFSNVQFADLNIRHYNTNMSYQLISRNKARATKVYDCIWCFEKIIKGEKYIREVSKYQKNLQDHKWHPECYEIAKIYFLKSGEEEFSPYECKRGSLEHA